MLKQIKSSNGINKHRAWQCTETGVIISSNDDMSGDKFYIGESEYHGMKWFSSPKEALKFALEELHKMTNNTPKYTSGEWSVSDKDCTGNIGDISIYTQKGKKRRSCYEARKPYLS